jgi:hypothetical protein
MIHIAFLPDGKFLGCDWSIEAISYSISQKVLQKMEKNMRTQFSHGDFAPDIAT